MKHLDPSICIENRPTQIWMSEYTKMCAFFDAYHPSKSLLGSHCLVTKFAAFLKKKFPNKNIKLLLHVSRTLTRSRIQLINLQKREEKKLKRAARAAEILEKIKKPATKFIQKKISKVKNLSIRGGKKLNQLVSHSYKLRLSVRGANKLTELSN